MSLKEINSIAPPTKALAVGSNQIIPAFAETPMNISKEVVPVLNGAMGSVPADVIGQAVSSVGGVVSAIHEVKRKLKGILKKHQNGCKCVQRPKPLSVYESNSETQKQIDEKVKQLAQEIKQELQVKSTNLSTSIR